MTQALQPLVRNYRLNGEAWSGLIAAAIARQSIAECPDQITVRKKLKFNVADLRAIAMTMRGFFLADPHELSLLVYVEQAAGGTVRPSASCIVFAAGTINCQSGWRMAYVLPYAFNNLHGA